jgi:hypothetical protein
MRNLVMQLKNLLAGVAMVAAWLAMASGASAGTKGDLLLNRIGPVSSELYVSNADGSAERKLISTAGFDYHASFSKDGQWVVFTSERDGLGQSNLYRVKADGTGLQRLTSHVAVDDAAVFSRHRSEYHRLRVLAQRRRVTAPPTSGF